MTKEEYQDFVLRYKGCGACFPMHHTLSRFEKMWFTAIQKDVADLEKENEELKEINTHTISQLNLDNGELIIELTKAKEIIKLLLWDLRNRSYELVKDVERAEQFLNEV